jgi:hypothetical protein
MSFQGDLFPTLPPDGNGHIRADLSAKGASGTGDLILPDRIEIALTVHFFTNLNQLLRARKGTEAATFTSFLVYRNLCHRNFRKEKMIRIKMNNIFAL